MSNMLKEKKEKVLSIIVYFFIAFLFMLIFSDNTSPLAKYWYGSDASLYMFFGKAMKHGMLPYRDVFDHKGPYFFHLQEIAQILWEGKNGIFILQIVSLFICLFIGDKIIRLLNKNFSLWKRILILFPLLWIFAATQEGGLTNEEFSLPFSFVSLYGILCYFKKTSLGNYFHNPLLALLYGVFFGLIAFSRINNSAFLCSVILTVVIILIEKKEFLNLFKNAIAFIVGFSLVVIPILVFYKANNLLEEMLYSCFLFAFEYATKNSFLNKLKYYIVNIDITFVLSMFLPLLFIKKINNKNEIMFFVISISATIVATFVGYNYTHYFILTLPNIMYCIYLCVKYLDFVVPLLKKKLIVIFVALIIIAQGYNVALHFANSMIHILDVNITYHMKDYYKYMGDESVDIVNKIPENEKDSFWGYGIGSKFYLRTDIYPCIKYYDFVYMYFSESLGNVKSELMDILYNKSPKWIVVPKKETSIPKEIRTFLNGNYELFYQNNEFELYNNID